MHFSKLINCSIKCFCHPRFSPIKVRYRTFAPTSRIKGSHELCQVGQVPDECLVEATPGVNLLDGDELVHAGLGQCCYDMVGWTDFVVGDPVAEDFSVRKENADFSCSQF